MGRKQKGTEGDGSGARSGGLCRFIMWRTIEDVKIIQVIAAPVLYCWRETAERAKELPYPKAMHVMMTAGASTVTYFLLYALVKGVVSCF